MQPTDEMRRAQSDARDAVQNWYRARREANAHPGNATLDERREAADRAAWRAVHLLADGPTACATDHKAVMLDEALLVVACPKGMEIDPGLPGYAESLLVIRVEDIVRLD